MERQYSHGRCESWHWEGRFLGSFGGPGEGRGDAVGAAPTASLPRPAGRLSQQSFGRDGAAIHQERTDGCARLCRHSQREGGSSSRIGWRPRRTSERIVSRRQAGLERSEELQQRVRIVEEQLARTSAVLMAIRLRLRRRRQSFSEDELRPAWKRRDLAATFRWSRLLGGRRWKGQEEGQQGVLSAALSSRKAWQDEWTKPGAEGGMGRRRFSKTGRNGLRPETSCKEVGAQGRGGWRGKEGSWRSL